jgi:PAS domain S-box-containing protein
MASKVMPIDQIEYITKNLKPNKVLSLISITLLALMGFFAGKLVIILFFSSIQPWTNEIITIISCCLAINIAAYLILYKYQLLINYLENRIAIKSTNLQHAINNLTLEIAERHEAKYFLKNVFDYCDDSIFILDQHGIITKWNKAAEDTFGYSFNELRGKSFFTFYANEKELDIMLLQLRRDGFVRRYEINMQKSDGSVATFAISTRILRDKKKRIIGSVCVSRDGSDTHVEIFKLKTLNEHLLQELNERKLAEEKQPQWAARCNHPTTRCQLLRYLL